MGSQKIVEMSQIVAAFGPVDLQAGANDGDWVNLKDYGHLAVIFFKAVGTAGDDPTLTLEQATDNAGGSAKGLNFDTIHTKQGADLTAIAQFTKVTQTADSEYTDATSAEVAAIWVVELDAEDLDVSNGFDHVRARVADVGSNAQLGACLYLLTQPRYAKATPPSAL